MRHLTLARTGAVVLATAAAGCASVQNMDPATTRADAPAPQAPAAAASNPLLAPWTGPHGGIPPFDRVR
ncbi:MAG TPA: hypothetical protein VK420_08140, partial [Longimicrobium sp.]|nr:hypothetical protein [Longimicrobium sp.]